MDGHQTDRPVDESECIAGSRALGAVGRPLVAFAVAEPSRIEHGIQPGLSR
jgi:hypothetical protein